MLSGKHSLCTLLLSLPLGCSVGEGTGEVQSDQLIVQNCWDGPFDLRPDFFGANPFGDTMILRIQRGEQAVETSDGVVLVVNDVARIRESQLGTPIPLGLPIGVSPPGIPLRVNTEPPQVSLALHLHRTCHVQNAALYSVDGWIRFDSLFSGDRNESSAEDRLTDATFEAVVGDPRNLEIDEEGSTATEPSIVYRDTSSLSGRFRFYFHRGIPAQPFP